jgi:hypothetical protein
MRFTLDADLYVNAHQRRKENEMTERRFADQIAVVTGAAQGIGRATAMQLAREGATVLVADRAAAPAQAVVDEINAAGGSAHVAVHDLEHREGAVDLFARAKKDFGRVDVSVHNVGGTIWAKPYWEYQPEEIVAEIQRSLWPTMWCCHAVLPLMLEANRGAIVNIGSVATRGVNRVPYADPGQLRRPGRRQRRARHPAQSQSADGSGHQGFRRSRRADVARHLDEAIRSAGRIGGGDLLFRLARRVLHHRPDAVRRRRRDWLIWWGERPIPLIHSARSKPSGA